MTKYTSNHAHCGSMILVSFLLLVSAFIGSPQNLKAQSSVEASVNVTATVTGSIEVITVQAMSISEQDIENNEVLIVPINPNAGRLVARGNPGAGIRLNYVQTQQLRNMQTNNLLTIEYLVSGNSTDQQESAETLSPQDRDVQFNEDGEFYIWVGARIDLTMAEPGSYEGEFSFEVDYI